MGKFMQEREASVQPIKSALKLKILDDSDIRAIDETALKILEEIGVYMPLERALKIYADAGAKVDFEHQIVKIPADLVKKIPRLEKIGNIIISIPRDYDTNWQEEEHVRRLASVIRLANLSWR